MASTFGNKIKLSVFGQSHSEYIGAVLDGIPSGFRLDIDKLSSFLSRRAPAGKSYATARKEVDSVQIVSGLYRGATCGAPICMLIANTDVKSDGYQSFCETPRPSHSDFAALMKYGDFHDIRGGGHLSGRLTAPLCAAGGIAIQLLEREGIFIGAHIASIGSLRDNLFDPVKVSADDFPKPPDGFPVLSREAGEKMLALIESARSEGDSLGGIIECAVVGLKSGIGDPLYDGIESRISSIIFSIPAVKGIEFGNGFACASLKGSENNDSFEISADSGNILTKTNNHGGILGGISSGMPILFRVAIKPAPSIAVLQESVNLKTGSAVKLAISGRHDPCVAPRAVPCVEAAAALALLDLLL